MSQAMPIFGQFMNAKGLKVLIDNFEIYGTEQLKGMADEFMQEMAQDQKMKQQQAQQEMQNNPMVLKAKNDQMKMVLEQKQDQVENQLKAATIAIDKQQADTDFLKVLADVHSAKAEAEATRMKAHAEETRAAVDLAIKHADMQHSHRMDKHDRVHEQIMDHRSHNLEERKLENEITQANKPTVTKE